MSIGGTYPDNGEDETLIKNADTAMYHARNLGATTTSSLDRT
jgi:GGDEF domain-containing protein